MRQPVPHLVVSIALWRQLQASIVGNLTDVAARAIQQTLHNDEQSSSQPTRPGVVDVTRAHAMESLEASVTSAAAAQAAAEVASVTAAKALTFKFQEDAEAHAAKTRYEKDIYKAATAANKSAAAQAAAVAAKAQLKKTKDMAYAEDATRASASAQHIAQVAIAIAQAGLKSAKANAAKAMHLEQKGLAEAHAEKMTYEQDALEAVIAANKSAASQAVAAAATAQLKREKRIEKETLIAANARTLEQDVLLADASAQAAAMVASDMAVKAMFSDQQDIAEAIRATMRYEQETKNDTIAGGTSAGTKDSASMAELKYERAASMAKEMFVAADRAKMRYEQESMKAVLAANRSEASQAAAALAELQFERAKRIEVERSAAAEAARARLDNITVSEQQEAAEAFGVMLRYEEEAKNASIAANKSAALQAAAISAKAQLERAKRIEEEKSAAAETARARLDNATLSEQQEAAEALAAKLSYEHEAMNAAIAANRSAALQAAAVSAKTQLERAKIIEEEKSAAVEVAKARFDNATRIEQKEAAEARASKARYEQAYVDAAKKTHAEENQKRSVNAAKQYLAKADKELRNVALEESKLEIVKAQVHAEEAKAQSEVDAAEDAQLWSVIPWLLLGLMLPYVIYSALTRKLFNQTLDGNSSLEEGLMESYLTIESTQVKPSEKAVEHMNSASPLVEPSENAVEHMNSTSPLVESGERSHDQNSSLRKKSKVKDWVNHLEGRHVLGSAQHKPHVTPFAFPREHEQVEPPADAFVPNAVSLINSNAHVPYGLPFLQSAKEEERPTDSRALRGEEDAVSISSTICTSKDEMHPPKYQGA